MYVFGVNPEKVELDWNVVPLMLYSKLAPIGEETTIVPVFTLQVGWAVALAIGAEIVGMAFIVTLVAEDVQPDGDFFTITEYVFGANPEKVALAWKLIPSILYKLPVPVGEETTIVPVGVVHVGWIVALAVGALGFVHP